MTAAEKTFWASWNQLIMSNMTYFLGEIDEYLSYLGGTAGALTITGIVAASAYYFASRPIPEKPLVPLHQQSPILEFGQKNGQSKQSEVVSTTV